MSSFRKSNSLPKSYLKLTAAIPAAFAGLGLAIAFAADVPIHAPPVQGVNWDGIYVGLNRGIAEGHASWSNPTGFFALFPDVPGRGAHEGLFGGVQLGYNRQLGAIVFGVEGDASFGSLDSNTVCGAIVGFGGSGDPCHARTNVMASVTGRLGYAVGRALVYGKGGGAFADEHYDVISTLFFPVIPAIPALGSAGRFGWTAGAGIEYALGPAFGGEWSARAEYDYYNFGTRTIGFNIPLFPGMNSFSIERDQHLAKFSLNYRLAGPDIAAPAPAFAGDFTGEFGSRLGGSGGRFHKNLFDPFIPQQLNSRLTWAGQPGLMLENFARVDHVSGLFAKGYVGGIDLFTAHINDEDFPPGIFPYSNTISSTKNGRDFYDSADIGYSFLRNAGWRLDGFVGYQYYSQRMNAIGCTQIASQPFICPPGIVPAYTLILGQSEHWNAARVGLAADVYLPAGFKWRIEGAWLPYMAFNGMDNHWLRPDINPLIETGHGHNGYQFESVLSYALTDRIDIGIGGRYWQFFAQHGSTQFPGFGIPQSPENFASSRAMGFVQASYKFGEVAAPAVVSKY
ncbi:MAG TPA: outer membrane beta-barrel protein [Methylocella sp.]|nr:outer membrane beta-barrel protein [Methylocella sp.]